MSPYAIAIDYLQKHEQAALVTAQKVAESMPEETRELVIRSTLRVGFRLALESMCSQLKKEA